MTATAVAPPAPRMRWWGWGRDEDAWRLPEAAERTLREALGVTEAPSPRPPLEELRLPERRLPAEVITRLERAVGQGLVRSDRLARVTHAVGRSYPDLVRLRSGELRAAPDAVVYPGSHEQVVELLTICDEAGVAVVPFGGGTSVVGGVEPRDAGFEGAISLDLARMAGLLAVDRGSLMARFEPGATGPAAEAALGVYGLTLGHFPQSFEYATLGGFAATRSAGQASTGYGRFDELVLGLRLAAPAGELVVAPHPASAAGPALRELVVGSEGTLGVITELVLAARPAPQTRRYECWSFRSFAQGLDAFREMEQERSSADVARLLDEAESALTRRLGAGDSLAERVGDAYLRLRGHDGACIAILGFEGEGEEVADRLARSRELMRSADGIALGARPGAAWERSRFRTPYLRDELLDRGVMVETLETATSWSRLLALYESVRAALGDALRARGTPPLVTCHVSHLYPSGASLYFTFLARQERGLELEQWETAKAAASEAIVAGGGTITHHHAVGVDHRRWLEREIGPMGVELLRAMKRRLDPRGVMNPGKLIPG